MPVNGVTSNTATNASTITTASNTMDKDAFLKLLVTQIQYQDPMDPISNSDYAAQLAQFSSLEQMQQMNESLTSFGKASTASQAFGLVGKWIDYTTANGSTITGKVDGVSFSDGEAMLNMGSASIAMDSVEHVYPDMDALGQSRMTSQAIAMVGNYVSYTDPDTGNSVTGKIDSITMADGWPKFVIGEDTVSASSILGMKDKDADSSDEALAAMRSLIGHKIDYTDSTGSTVSAKVSSVNTEGDKPQLMVGNNILIDMDDVVNIY